MVFITNNVVLSERKSTVKQALLITVILIVFATLIGCDTAPKERVITDDEYIPNVSDEALRKGEDAMAYENSLGGILDAELGDKTEGDVLKNIEELDVRMNSISYPGFSVALSPEIKGFFNVSYRRNGVSKINFKPYKATLTVNTVTVEKGTVPESLHIKCKPKYFDRESGKIIELNCLYEYRVTNPDEFLYYYNMYMEEVSDLEMIYARERLRRNGF